MCYRTNDIKYIQLLKSLKNFLIVISKTNISFQNTFFFSFFGMCWFWEIDVFVSGLLKVLESLQV